MVVRPTAGEDILCLDVFTGLQAETTVCLGKKGGVILPLRASLRNGIENRIRERLNWVEIEKDISDVLSGSRVED